eukprot:scaffold4809_cov116-Cylindrotheca_fusiformis.AAC.12
MECDGIANPKVDNIRVLCSKEFDILYGQSVSSLLRHNVASLLEQGRSRTTRTNACLSYR